jgi:hypothetical protein
MGGSLHITRSATSSNYTRGIVPVTGLSGLSYGTYEASVGGYYAGAIQWPNGNVYDLVIPPKNTWPTDPTYNKDVFPGLTKWSNTYASLNCTDAEVRLFSYDGKAATIAWANAGFIGATDLHNKTINGFNDWYVPSVTELYEIYRNLKPTANLNSTSNIYGRFSPYTAEYTGIYQDGVQPRAVGGLTFVGTSTNPAQTTAIDFISPTGSQAFVWSGPTGELWASTPSKNLQSDAADIPTDIWSLYTIQYSGAGFLMPGAWSANPKTELSYRVPVRRILRT